MERVEGIGGVFLYANDPAALARWYSDVLGISLIANEQCDNFYTQFEQRDPRDTSRQISTVFAIMRAENPLAASGRHECMVNYRVTNLESMIHQMRAAGVEIYKQEDYDYGRFAWAKDPEGNSIELYQQTDGGAS